MPTFTSTETVDNHHNFPSSRSDYFGASRHYWRERLTIITFSFVQLGFRLLDLHCSRDHLRFTFTLLLFKSGDSGKTTYKLYCLIVLALLKLFSVIVREVLKYYSMSCDNRAAHIYVEALRMPQEKVRYLTNMTWSEYKRFGLAALARRANTSGCNNELFFQNHHEQENLDTDKGVSSTPRPPPGFEPLTQPLSEEIDLNVYLDAYLVRFGTNNGKTRDESESSPFDDPKIQQLIGLRIDPNNKIDWNTLNMVMGLE